MSDIPSDIIVLRRDIVGLLVPSGARVPLNRGTEVRITQALGNSFSVSVYGNLARIDAKDADALGMVVHDALNHLSVNASIDDMVWAQLKTVYDPEIPVNIVDLGLIYNSEIMEQVDGGYHVNIDMTLTAPACGMGPVLVADVKEKLMAIPGVSEANVTMVFDPPWDQNRMSDVAKLELGML